MVRRGRQVQRPAARRSRHGRASPSCGRSSPRDRTTYMYYPHTQAVPAGQAAAGPQPAAHDHGRRRHPRRRRRRRARLQGGVDGGFIFFVKDGQLHYTYNYVAADYFRVVVQASDVPSGSVALRLRVRAHRTSPTSPTGRARPGTPRCSSTQASSAGASCPYTIPLALGLAAGVCVGRDEGAPVCDDYQRPVRLHRHDPSRDHRRLGRPHRRRGSRDEGDPRPAMTTRAPRTVSRRRASRSTRARRVRPTELVGGRRRVASEHARRPSRAEGCAGGPAPPERRGARRSARRSDGRAVAAAAQVP